jgi:hypothetical protein
MLIFLFNSFGRLTSHKALGTHLSNVSVSPLSAETGFTIEIVKRARQRQQDSRLLVFGPVANVGYSLWCHLYVSFRLSVVAVVAHTSSFLFVVTTTYTPNRVCRWSLSGYS